MKRFLCVAAIVTLLPLSAYGWMMIGRGAVSVEEQTCSWEQSVPSAGTIASICSDANWGSPNWAGQVSEAARDSRYSTRHYTTVSAWESAIDGEMAGGNQTGEIYGQTDDAATFYFTNFADSENWVILKAAPGQEADGTDNAGAVVTQRMILSETTNQINVFIDGIEFTNRLSLTADNADSQFIITRCVFRDVVDAHGISIDSCADISIKIGACLFRDITSESMAGIALIDSDIATEAIVHNCTFYNCYYGIRESSGTFTSIKNCAAVCNAVNASYVDYYSAPSNVSYCGSSDATATGTGSINTLTTTDEFTATGSDDFSVQDTAAHIYQSGTCIDTYTWMPATGIGGNSWAENPSMGAFEYAD